MMMMMEVEGLGDMLMKVAVFAVVQALVYVILSKSSNIFSKNKKLRTNNSFKPARSVSIRRILAVLQDLPPGGETSPSSNSKDLQSPTGDDSVTGSSGSGSASDSVSDQRYCL
ncbi:Transcription termination factor like [Melia azedarach]|uniref:Transcription termination factor like n=1 Tax=Melia azedarach TaxID=155640 RepID=A0ACC1XJK1_MELAZ|nr:Transcription termination factor like [Melia azedarach]